MGLWSWLRESWSGSAPERSAPATGAHGSALAAPADPGWRALPPVQRALGDGAPSVAHLGSFAASLAAWQNPRMLTGLEHGRGPSAPSGSAVGLVDPAPGPPGVAELPVFPVPLTALPGSASAAVQREVRFDPPGAARTSGFAGAPVDGTGRPDVAVAQAGSAPVLGSNAVVPVSGSDAALAPSG